jgi:hypothetical protein
VNDHHWHWFNTLSAAISVTGLAVLTFLAGAITTKFEVFPYPQLLERPLMGLEAYLERTTYEATPHTDHRWRQVNHDKRGVTRHRPESSFGGFTAYHTSNFTTELIDMEGRRVHAWHKPFDELWSDPPHIDHPVPNEQTHLGALHVYENGDLLATYSALDDTPYGYGLVKLDRDSNVLWKYPDRVHHDISLAPSGAIWTLTHRFRVLPDSSHIPTSYKDTQILADAIVKVSVHGKHLKHMSLLDMVFDSPLGEQVAEHHQGESWDLLHTNNVEPLPADFAEHHNFAEPGYLLVSFRELSTIAVVDPDDEKLVWSTDGFWEKQHDPDPMPNGNLMIFDNQGWEGPGGTSRIAEFDPASEEIAWSYTGSSEEPFETEWGGSQTPLPNGNVLITETLEGRLFEVTREGEIVWEYYNPTRTRAKGADFIYQLPSGVQRLSADSPRFWE